MTTEEIRRKAELRVGTIGVNEETQKALVNWIVLTVREATAQNNSHTTEEIMKPFIDKYDPVGSGIDNVHYWWIRTYFEKALTQNTADTLERGIGIGFHKAQDAVFKMKTPENAYVVNSILRNLTSLTPTPLESNKTK
jgi:hypothetical protein